VDRLGDQLLPGAALAGDEHGRLERRHVSTVLKTACMRAERPTMFSMW